MTSLSQYETSRTELLTKGSKPAIVNEKELQFYTHNICPFAHRTAIALEKHQVPHETVLIQIGEDKPEWFTQEINPRGTVPVLRHGGNLIYESSVTTEFVDESFAKEGDSLLSQDLILRAASRVVVADFESKLLATLFGFLSNNEESKEQEKRDALVSGLKWINDAYEAQSNGPFFLGENFTYADLCIFPFLYRMDIAYKRYLNLDLFSLPHTDRLRLVLEEGKKVDFVKTTLPAVEYVQEGLKKFAVNRWDYKN